MNTKRPIAIALCLSTFLQLAPLSVGYTDNTELYLTTEHTSDEIQTLDGSNITTRDELYNYLLSKGVPINETNTAGDRVFITAATTLSEDFTVPAGVILIAQGKMTINCNITVKGTIQDNRGVDYNNNDIVNGTGSVVIEEGGAYKRYYSNTEYSIVGNGGYFTLGTGASMTLTSGNCDITTGTVTLGKDVSTKEVTAISIQEDASLEKGAFSVATDVTITDNNEGSGGMDDDDDNTGGVVDGSNITNQAELLEFLTNHLSSQGVSCDTNNTTDRVFVRTAAKLSADFVVPQGVTLIFLQTMDIACDITVNGTIQDNRGVANNNNDIVNGTGSVVIEEGGAYKRYYANTEYTIIGSGGYFTLGSGATMTLTSGNYDITTGIVELAKAITTGEVGTITSQTGATFTYDKANVGTGITINGQDPNENTGGDEDGNTDGNTDGSDITTHAEYMAFLVSKGLSCTLGGNGDRVFIESAAVIDFDLVIPQGILLIPKGELTVNNTITVKGSIQDNRMSNATSDIVNGSGKIVIESTGAYAKYTGVGSAYPVIGAGGYLTLVSGATVTLTSENDKVNYEVSSGTVTLAQAVTTTDIPAITVLDGATFTYEDANVGSGVTINGQTVGGGSGEEGDTTLSNQQKLFNALVDACGGEGGLSMYSDSMTVAISQPVTLSKDVTVLSNSKIQIATGGSLTIVEDVTLHVNHIVQDSRAITERPDGVISGKGAMVFYTGSQYYINGVCLVGSAGRLQQGASSEITITSIKDRNTVSEMFATGNELEITKGNVNLSAAIDATVIQRISVGIDGTFSPNLALIAEDIEYLAPKLERVALLEVLNVAKANVANTKVSANGIDVGSDVYWVTQDVLNTYESTINAAQAVWDNDTLDNDKYAETKEILITAHNAFNDSKVLGSATTDIIDTAQEIVDYLNSQTTGCAAINGTENPDGISLTVVEVTKDVVIDRNFTIPETVRLRTTAQMTVNADITVDGQVQDYRDAGFISGSGLVGTNGTGRVIFHEGSGGLYIKGQGKMVGAQGTGASSADGVLVATGEDASFALTNRNNLVVLSGNVNLTAQIPAVLTTSIVVNEEASFTAKGALADSIAMNCYGTYIDQSILNTSVILNGVATTVKSNSSENVLATMEDGYLKFEVDNQDKLVQENDVEVVFANATGEEAVVSFSVINGAIRGKNIVKFGSMTAEQLNTEITAKIEKLQGLVKQAEAKGLGAEYEKSTLWFAEQFQIYADWDDTATGQAQNLKMFQSVSYSPYGKTAEDLAKELPEFERTEIIEMLDRSITEIEQVISGDIVRRDVNMFDWAGITHEGSNFYDENGKAVFLHDYFSKPLTVATNNPILYNHYMGMVDKPTSINANLVTSSSGGIDTANINSITTRPEGAGAGYMMLWHTTLPSWFSIAQGNSIWDGYSNFTKYDIDSEELRDLWATALEAIIPSTEQAPYTVMGYCAANEPHWFLDQSHWGMIKLYEDGSAGFSELSHDKLEEWLENKYTSIEALNTAYGNDAKGNAFNFTSFEDASDQLVPLVPATHKGTPAWYDVCVFNMERSLEWLTFLNDEIVDNNEYAKTHYKIMPDLFAEEDRSHGINFEDVTNMAGMIGDDAKIRTENNLKNTGHDETEWNEDYAYMWREVVITYDFLSSVAPDKAHVNSEVHFLSTTAWRDLYMDPEYVRSTYWLGTVLGMDAGFTWFWGREDNGEIETRLQTTDNTGLLESYPASVAQQPQVANALSTTMMELNAFSEEVVALQEQERPLRVFYSETSAIVKTHHMTELYELNESLIFEGYPIGYVTENILNNPENKDFYKQENFDVVIVYKTEYVTDAEFDALQGYLDKGGVVVLDEVSLKMDEHGKPRTETLTAGGGAIIHAAATTTGITAQALSATRDLSPITVTEENGNSKDQKGVVWRVIPAQDGSDNYVVSLMNLGKYDAVMTLDGVDSVTNMLTQETLSKEVSIPSEGVMLLEVTVEPASSSTYTVSFNANGGTVDVSSLETTTEGTLTRLPIPYRSGYNFQGWYTALTGGTKVEENRVYTSDTTIYARWTSTGGGGSTTPAPDTDDGSTGGSGGGTGGSGGGTSGSGGGTTTTPDTTTPDTTTPESSTVVTKDPESIGNSTSSSATVTTESVDGKVEATVDDEIFDTLVSDTVESSKDAETRPEVVITVETSDDAKADSVEVTLSTGSLETLAQTETGVLTVESQVGSITFDNQALTTITKDSSETYTIAISQVSSSSLNDKQTATVGNSPVYDLSVISSNGYVTDFDGGYATVKLPYTLKSGENPNCLYVYYVDSNGNINKMQTMYDAQNQMIVFNTSHFSVFTIVHELLSLIFNDVDENDWHFDYVSFAYQNDLFGGTSKTAFSPDTAMSRGMLVQTLNSYERNPEATVEANYPDVQSNQWFAAAVDWATERNIVSGMKNGTFAPDESVTREQLALILFNYAKDKGYDVSDSERLSSFPDADSVSSWAEEALSWAYGNGLITGMNGKLSPDSFATRAQVAVILKNFINLYA